MIPKIIHYCWFGGNPLPKLARKCIKSWKKHCPEYQLVRWDESNFDLSSCPLYVRQAYEVGQWAFVSDYVRLKVVHDCGGVYLDTDVELLKPLDELLSHKAYFGFEDARAINAVSNDLTGAPVYVATGLGFGAEKGAIILQEMMNDYLDIPFILEDGAYDQETCPRRNTGALVRHGLKQDNSLQIIGDDILVLPSHWLCPFDYWAGIGEITDETISIHWFSASWMEEEQRQARKKRVKNRKKANRKEYIRYLPNRLALKVMGQNRYDKVRAFFKRKSS